VNEQRCLIKCSNSSSSSSLKFKQVIKKMRGKTVRFILNKYTTPEAIRTLDKGQFGEEMRRRSMGKLGIKDAELLINLARGTVGIKEGVRGVALDIRHIIAQLDAIDRFIAEIEAEMTLTLERIPCSMRLFSIKGLTRRLCCRVDRGGGGFLKVHNPVGNHEACRPRSL